MSLVMVMITSVQNHRYYYLIIIIIITIISRSCFKRMKLNEIKSSFGCRWQGDIGRASRGVGQGSLKSLALLDHTAHWLGTLCNLWICAIWFTSNFPILLCRLATHYHVDWQQLTTVYVIQVFHYHSMLTCKLSNTSPKKGKRKWHP